MLNVRTILVLIHIKMYGGINIKIFSQAYIVFWIFNFKMTKLDKK